MVFESCIHIHTQAVLIDHITEHLSKNTSGKSSEDIRHWAVQGCSAAHVSGTPLAESKVHGEVGEASSARSGLATPRAAQAALEAPLSFASAAAGASDAQAANFASTVPLTASAESAPAKAGSQMVAQTTGISDDLEELFKKDTDDDPELAWLGRVSPDCDDEDIHTCMYMRTLNMYMNRLIAKHITKTTYTRTSNIIQQKQHICIFVCRTVACQLMKVTFVEI